MLSLRPKNGIKVIRVFGVSWIVFRLAEKTIHESHEIHEGDVAVVFESRI